MEIEELPPKKEFETVLPMINIIFLLLIFFMLAGSFTQPDLFNITLPEANAEQPADITQLTISMNANKEYAIETQAYNEAALLALVTEKVASADKVVVQLKADQSVKSADLIDTMELLGKTGLSSLDLLTTVSPPGESH